MAIDSLPDLTKYNDFANDMANQYKNKYAYRIAGKDDSFYRSLANAIETEGTQNALKSRRTQTVTTVNQLTALGDGTSGTQYIDAAKERIKFIKDAVAALRNVATTSNPSLVASAVNEASKELSISVDQYLKGRYAGASNSGDAEFLESARQLQQQITYMANTQKGRLAGEGTFFNSGLSSTKVYMKKIGDAIETIKLLPPTFVSTTTTTTSSTTTSSVDITV